MKDAQDTMKDVERKSLTELAMEHGLRGSSRMPADKEEFELCMAYVMGKIARFQVGRVLGISSAGVSPWSGRVLVAAVRAGWLCQTEGIK